MNRVITVTLMDKAISPIYDIFATAYSYFVEIAIYGLYFRFIIVRFLTPEKKQRKNDQDDFHDTPFCGG